MREEPRGSSRSQRACAVVLGALLLLAISLAAATPFTPGDANDKARDRHDVESPAPFHARGRLVCLAEEMKERFKAEVDPVHEHLLGFAVEEERSIGPAATSNDGKREARDVERYVTILRTKQSEALFVDDRFAKRELILIGREFPRSAIVELAGVEWIHDGRRFEPYYWCEVCSIRGVDPGPCSCCQGRVVLREEDLGPAPAQEGQRTAEKKNAPQRTQRTQGRGEKNSPRRTQRTQ
ncbi:MAG TPA: hypothetical protein VK116_04975, partial [Planctomycetota bacterium]|nr:hypothetical protein [Planctomycetota bacterium]